jgi:hypothetical protein
LSNEITFPHSSFGFNASRFPFCDEKVNLVKVCTPVCSSDDGVVLPLLLKKAATLGVQFLCVGRRSSTGGGGVSRLNS